MEENSMLENLSPTDEHSKRQEKYLPLKNLVRQHSYWSVVLLSIYAVIVLQCLRFIIFLLDLSPYKVPYVPGSLISEAILVLLWVFIPLYVLNWWNTPGFQMLLTWPLHIRSHRTLFLGLFLLLCLSPLLLLAFSKTIHQTPLSTIVMVTVLCLFVGIAEEGLFRGLILNMLLPKGIWRAVLLSSFLFGSVHILNVFVGFPLNSTMRGVFQCFEGIELLHIRVGSTFKTQILRLQPLHQKILRLLGSPYQQCYFCLPETAERGPNGEKRAVSQGRTPIYNPLPISF